MRGGYPMPHDVGAFLCLVGEWSGFSRWLNLHNLGRVTFQDSVKQIDAFLKESFQDSPGGAGDMESPSYYSFAASLVDLFGHEYGWSEADILDAPIKRLFQYVKAISRRSGEAVLFNPSDRVRGEWMDVVNNKE
jgi:hypothetical protein